MHYPSSAAWSLVEKRSRGQPLALFLSCSPANLSEEPCFTQPHGTAQVLSVSIACVGRTRCLTVVDEAGRPRAEVAVDAPVPGPGVPSPRPQHLPQVPSPNQVTQPPKHGSNCSPIGCAPAMRELTPRNSLPQEYQGEMSRSANPELRVTPLVSRPLPAPVPRELGL
jgi:hypothetical protein